MALKLINNLQKLGFTENEAKIYATLVCINMATAREIYETSRVPRPKVYKVLRGMEEKGYVQIIEGDPIRFSCIRPEDLITRIRNDFLLSLNETFCRLHALNPSPEGKVLSSGESMELGMEC
ncbi:Transcriptional regulator, TrmB family [Methanosarcina siciliae HI350]|uniref:Transcriptional regulator, TrmB family n=1 Tax=Methanosarcina siciliae HI350 TaxID=1434119 RepID=A0A0E3PDM1_9EURY|nr:helix-turn-helix domain-containing protein [Methanosarcina siciliae]AKB32624.1 Transcriptional regulator, TrmB family [Methanosarcina siciliae HI350]